MPNICDENGDGSISIHECCRAMGKIYLLLVCGLFLTLAVIQLIIATKAQVSSPPGIGINAVYVTFGIGAGVLITSIVGFVGVIKMNRCWFGTFSCMMILLAIGMLVVSVMVSSFTSQSIDTTSIEVENFLNCTYMGCCTRCPVEASSSNRDGYCRKQNISCNKRNANVNPSLCASIENSDLIENCAKNPQAFSVTMLSVVKRQFTTMIIVLLSSFGLILISLTLSIYFTVAKKVHDVMDDLPEHHHAQSKTEAYAHKA
jgi:hypothetical protein